MRLGRRLDYRISIRYAMWTVDVSSAVLISTTNHWFQLLHEDLERVLMLLFVSSIVGLTYFLSNLHPILPKVTEVRIVQNTHHA